MNHLFKQIKEMADSSVIPVVVSVSTANDTNFKCALCQTVFITKSTLKQHEKQHKTPKLFTCTECGKLLSSKSNLLSHIKTHQKKTFQCTFCQLLYTSRAQLNEHMNTYKLHKCIFCEKNFNSFNSLLKHQNEVQCNTAARFACSLCPKLFTEESKQRAHERKVHIGQWSTDYQCPI